MSLSKTNERLIPPTSPALMASGASPNLTAGQAAQLEAVAVNQQGASLPKPNSQRRCISCGHSHDMADMLRFVVFDDQAAPKSDAKIAPQICFDLQARLPGRGIWLCAKHDCLSQAARKNAFARAARQKITNHNDMPRLVEQQLKAQAVKLMSLARRAGQLIAGGDKVEALLAQNPNSFALLALDAVAATHKNLQKAVQNASARINPFPCPFMAAELGPIFGRTHVAQMGLSGNSGLTAKLKLVMHKLQAVSGENLDSQIKDQSVS